MSWWDEKFILSERSESNVNPTSSAAYKNILESEILGLAERREFVYY